MFTNNRNHRLGSSNHSFVNSQTEYDVKCKNVEMVQLNDTVEMVENVNSKIEIDVTENNEIKTETNNVVEKITSIENIISATKVRQKILRKNSW